MIAWLILIVYELLAIELKAEDRRTGRETPWWRQPMTDPLWRLQHAHWLLRLATWTFVVWVAWHFTIEPLRTARDTA